MCQQQRATPAITSGGEGYSTPSLLFVRDLVSLDLKVMDTYAHFPCENLENSREAPPPKNDKHMIVFKVHDVNNWNALSLQGKT